MFADKITKLHRIMRQTLKANLFERTFLSLSYREAYQGMITRLKVVHLM